MSFGRDNHCTKQLTNGAKLSTATKQKRSDSFKTNLLAYTSVQPATASARHTLIKKLFFKDILSIYLNSINVKLQFDISSLMKWIFRSLSFNKFLLSVASRDLSQADKSNTRVSSFPMLCDG